MKTFLIIATLLGGLAALWFLRDKIVGCFRGGVSVSEHDVELYEKYKSLFIENGAAEFYRQHGFLGSFEEKYWRPLSHYVDTFDTVEHEFVDKTLNAAHKKVYSSAFRLGTTIAKHTVPIGKSGNLRSVKPDNLPFGPTPEHIKKEAQEINKLVPSFIKAHKKFVRLATSKLYGKKA